MEIMETKKYTNRNLKNKKQRFRDLWSNKDPIFISSESQRKGERE